MADTQPHSSTAQGLCAMCPEVGSLSCSGCRDIRYCSRECQKNDWPIHKIICKTSKDFSEAQRPGLDYRRAIRFPQNGSQPHFFWLPYATFFNPTLNGVGAVVHAPTIAILPGKPGEHREDNIEVFKSMILRRLVENGFDITGKIRWADSREDIPTDEVNTSLLKIHPELQEVWYGEIAICGTRRVNGIPTASYDVGALEFRHAVDMMNMIYDQVQDAQEKIAKGPSVQGVRVANISDTKQGGRETFEDLQVSAAQCTASSDIDTPICDRVGIPLVARRLPLALTGRDRPAGLIFEEKGMNPMMRFLNPSLPIINKGHGVGSAILVRKDGKPLYRAHVAAMAEYGKGICVEHGKKLRDFGTWGTVDLSGCTEAHFKPWYEAWKKKATMKDKVDYDVPSPYDV